MNSKFNRKEIGIIMESNGINAIDPELAEMIAEADTEDNGLIDFPEFISVLARKSLRVDDSAIDDIYKLLSNGGTDDGGGIDARSLLAVLADVGESTKFDERQLDELIRKACLYHQNDEFPTTPTPTTTNEDGTQDAAAAAGAVAPPPARITKQDLIEMIKSIDINHTKMKITRSFRR